MTKPEFKEIEQKFCSLFKLEFKDSDVMDKYTIDTVNGEYNVWFDKEKPFAIFGRFSKPNEVKFNERKVTINPFSGKMNFHGDDSILSFITTIDGMKIN